MAHGHTSAISSSHVVMICHAKMVMDATAARRDERFTRQKLYPDNEVRTSIPEHALYRPCFYYNDIGHSYLCASSAKPLPRTAQLTCLALTIVGARGGDSQGGSSQWSRRLGQGIAPWIIWGQSPWACIRRRGLLVGIERLDQNRRQPVKTRGMMKKTGFGGKGSLL